MKVKGGRFMVIFTFVYAGLQSMCLQASPEKRQIRLSLGRTASELQYKVHMRVFNPRYKRASGSERLIKNITYSLAPAYYDRSFVTIDVYKGQLDFKGETEGYIQSIEIEDVAANKRYQINQNTIDVINSIIMSHQKDDILDFKLTKKNPRVDPDGQIIRDQSYSILFKGVYEDPMERLRCAPEKKQVRFFVSDEGLQLKPNITIYKYNPQSNSIDAEGYALRQRQNEKRFRVVDVYKGSLSDGRTGYIENIEIEDNTSPMRAINKDTIDAINNQIDLYSRDGIINFQIIKKSGDRGYAVVYKGIYQPKSNVHYQDDPQEVEQELEYDPFEAFKASIIDETYEVSKK